MTAHAAQWTAPYPLWSDLLTDPAADKMQFGQPRILRFADDSFMEQFLGVLERHPARIEEFTAIPETWQEPAPAAQAVSLLAPADQESKLARSLKRLRVAENRFSSAVSLKAASTPASMPLKLYHPAHQRFYLVTASLVCGLKGLTDHKIDSGHQERVGFVVRRLLPPESVNSSRDLPDVDLRSWDEYALVTGLNGPGWKKVPKVAGGVLPGVATGEEQLPLFPNHYGEDDGRKRRVLAGVIPVGKREAYLGAGRSSETDPLNPASTARPKAARMVLFRTQVAEPWKNLISRAASVRQLLKDSEGEADAVPADVIKACREQIQVISWYILLDFAAYLQKYLGTFWQVVLDPSKGEADLDSSGEKNLFRALTVTTTVQFRTDLTTDDSRGTVYLSGDVAGSLRDALRFIGDPAANWREKLDTVTDVYSRSSANPGWPGFLFPLADPVSESLPQISTTLGPVTADDGVESEAAPNDGFSPAVQALRQNVDLLVALVTRALPTESTERTAPLPLAAEKMFDHREGWFVIRCVYERPNCGPLHPAEVSQATVPFQMAGFFDPDAPARPIRIPLPIDTSAAGLRKFDKNTAFMISDMLCGQIKRAKGLSLGDLVLSVLPWPFHKDLPVPDGGPCKSGSTQFGMICSLSIPIITICALILLMIIVSLLDAIFFWMPYFIICFPLPGFKAKKPASAGP
jgi:hypothetical protein